MTVRRLGDIVLSLVLLLACLPVLILAGLAVGLEQTAAPLFREVRLTRRGGTVSVFRFRTTRPTRFGPRTTRVGVFLRRWHLDEVPQLVNVLTGELSLVGGGTRIDASELKKVFALRDP